jgi:Tol biopolymer transport system component
LSGNGRYLLCDNNDKEAYFADLETSQQYQLTTSDADVGTSRRRITDDGTAVIGIAPLYVSRLGQTLATIGIGGSAAIDAYGATVVYTSSDGLHIFHIAQRQDTLVLRNDSSCSACFAISAPSISADGKRVLFLSDGVIQQLYTINADGTGLQDLTSSRESRGIKEYSSPTMVRWRGTPPVTVAS